MHVGQAALDAVVVEGQPRMVDPEQVQDGGVEVVPVGAVLDGFPADVIGRPVGHAVLQTRPRQPGREAVLVVVATNAEDIGTRLRKGGATELAGKEE